MFETYRWVIYRILVAVPRNIITLQRVTQLQLHEPKQLMVRPELDLHIAIIALKVVLGAAALALLQDEAFVPRLLVPAAGVPLLVEIPFQLWNSAVAA